MKKQEKQKVELCFRSKKAVMFSAEGEAVEISSQEQLEALLAELEVELTAETEQEKSN
ncbi:hypothetical protein [Bdellovibrio reynosensis]|uniref:Uncharacterized protein n=1 Tax=Bdellovibrio reynosensis TaxID=2835041 RepID=A0ABY4C4Q3_9BACT|nr:hypothetical protein [Bdellovibrio reynosensis]UOE99945.1 hypothetical protein MNR06_09565 [Bdellovibrio reynosensis]